MPSPWWIAICAGLLSGSFSALATYTLNYNRESNGYRRIKAEEFYLAVEQYMSLFKVTVLHDLSAKTIEGLPLTDAQSAEMAQSYKTIKMSSAIHFTMLTSKVETLFSSRDVIVKTINDKSKKLSDRSTSIKTYLHNMESCAEDIKMNIARVARHGGPLTLAEAAWQLLGFKK